MGWSEKYSFDESELEIILRCHKSVVHSKDQQVNDESFMSQLAHSFPYVYFFLPADEVQNRITLIENHILPGNFAEKFKKAILPLKGDETEKETTEMMIKGIANCFKGDSDETLGVIFDCCSDTDGTADPKDIIQLCYKLSICSQVLVSPRIDQERILTLSRQSLDFHGLTSSLSDMTKTKSKRVTKKTFTDWGKKCVPHIGSTMAGFVYNLVFHGKSSHSKVSPFMHPELLDSSNVFTESNSGHLFAISCMSPDLGGKWRRLFSSDMKDCSITLLEKCMAEHVGPTIFVIKLDSHRLIGGVAESGWKFGYFLFEIEPTTRIHHSKGIASKYFVRHNIEQTRIHGEKVNGTGFFANGGKTPDLFISDHFHWCKALFLDVPFSSKVEAFEVWGIEDLREGQSLKEIGMTKESALPHHPQ